MKLLQILLCVCFAFTVVGCGGGDSVAPKPSPIDLEKEQAKFDEYVETRTRQVMDDPNLSQAEKDKKIEEIKAYAKGQMKMLESMAKGGDDEREEPQQER